MMQLRNVKHTQARNKQAGNITPPDRRIAHVYVHTRSCVLTDKNPRVMFRSASFTSVS